MLAGRDERVRGDGEGEMPGWVVRRERFGLVPNAWAADRSGIDFGKINEQESLGEGDETGFEGR